MMAGTVESFRNSLAAEAPPDGADLALQALWWAGKGDWNKAHACAQQDEGNADCDLVHAHLHRVEGDLGNAGYWYRRAGVPMASDALPQEWEQIAVRLLSR
jgi:hypothetical protein